MSQKFMVISISFYLITEDNIIQTREKAGLARYGAGILSPQPSCFFLSINHLPTFTPHQDDIPTYLLVL